LIFSWKFLCQSEGEAGSAGEQPASNRIDVYTIKGQSILPTAFSFIGKLYGSKKLIMKDCF